MGAMGGFRGEPLAAARHCNGFARATGRRAVTQGDGMTTTTILAGSYERFVFGYSLDDAQAGDEAGGEAHLRKSFTIDAHTSSVKSIACNGGYAASGGGDDIIRVFHCDEDGAVADLGMCVGHQGDVRCLTFHAAGGYAPTRLLSGSADGALMVWDVSNNFELVKTMRAHRGGVSSISAHQSGRVALTCGADAHVAMWDMQKGRVAYKYKAPERVEALAFTKGGAEYITQAAQRISSTDVEAGNIVTTFTTPAKVLTFETSGRIVYAGCEGGDVYGYDMRTAAANGAVVRLASAHAQRVRGLVIPTTRLGETFGDSGPTRLVTAGSEGIVRAWDLRTAKSVHDDTPATSIASIDTGARYTCLCAMAPETPPDAPVPKLEPLPARKEGAKNIGNAAKGREQNKQPQKPKVVENKKQKRGKQPKRPAGFADDDDFEVVPQDNPSAGKQQPSRLDDDDDEDEAPYGKPTHMQKKKKNNNKKARPGVAYEKTATSARRKANNIKPQKRR